MVLSALSPARTVLLISDESLYIYKVTSQGARLVETVSWRIENFVRDVAKLLRDDCGGKPALLLNDMTDQHFKGGQRMPKVGPLDKANVVKRKLQMAFANYPIRGALAVKAPGQKAGLTLTRPSADKAQAAGGGSGDVYLFAAVPMSDPIVKTLAAVRESMVPIVGFVLLPVEAADMAAALSKKVAGKGGAPARWTIVIGQHHNGSLRQVIIRDGQLAMTRMTPVIGSAKDPVQWANEVNQEFKATLSYLSRFGYSPNEPTDIFIVGNQDATASLKRIMNIPASIHTHTAPEIASLLGIKIGMQEETRFADPVHAAWIGRKKSFILSMKGAEISSIDQPRKIVAAATALLLVSGAYFGYQVILQGQKKFQTQEEISFKTQEAQRVEVAYQQEVDRLKALGFDITLIQAAQNIHGVLQARRLPFLEMVRAIGRSLGDDMRLDSFEMAREEERPMGTGPLAMLNAGQPNAPRMQTFLRLSFPQTIDLDQGIASVNALRDRLATELPDFTVSVTRQVARPDYTARISGEASSTEQFAAEEDFNAEILIKGPKAASNAN